MSTFEWRKEYSVGIPSIDEQHKGFIKLINLESTSIPSKSTQVQLVEKLAQYAKEHFAYEEELFQKYSYIAASKHRSEHNKFIVQVADYKTRINQGITIPNLELYQFITNWLINHIIGEDKKYSQFLISQGVQ